MLFIRADRELALLRSSFLEAESVLRWEDPRLCHAHRAVSGWSPAQHLVHLSLVNETVFGKVETILDGQGETRGRCNLIGLFILGFRGIPRGRARAPESVRPGEAPGRRDGADALARASAKLATLEERSSSIARARGRARHFVFGSLGAAEWLRFARIHTRHHLRILREIAALTSAG